MTELNLTATDSKQQTVLENLIPLVSEALAEKINNGVYIEKDGKRLLNKKDLSTFMEYATEQAKNTAEQRNGAQAVCVHGDKIMSWAIHYFEEESIIGKLYNDDGTEYKPPKPVKKAVTPAVPYTPPKPAPKPQISIFDMVNEPAASAKPIIPSETVIVKQPETEQKQGSPMFRHYLSVKEKYKDCIVFYRLGDFYEMFNGDAVTAADVLNLTLTGRDCGLAKRVPMTGVPYHAADTYISKLVERGNKVAVCERLEGNGEETVERVIAPNPTEPAELADDDYDDLTEEEMRKFDGDLYEPAEPAEQSGDNDGFDLAAEKERLKAFDAEALCILGELFDDEIEIQ